MKFVIFLGYRFDDSFTRFEKELERVRRQMHTLDSPNPELNIPNPYIEDVNGDKKLQIRFDCKKFKPEEIIVKTQGHKLHVHAKHDEVKPGRRVHIGFTRNFQIPKEVDPASFKCVLSNDGVLQIEAPAPHAIDPPKENLIPLEKLEI